MRHQDALVRTTLTLDDDVAELLREEARRSKEPFKRVVNRAIRRGLRTDAPSERKPFVVRTFDLGLKPGIDRDKLGQLADQLEVEAFLQKHRRFDREE
jgi:hypothetical protein